MGSATSTWLSRAAGIRVQGGLIRGISFHKLLRELPRSKRLNTVESYCRACGVGASDLGHGELQTIRSGLELGFAYNALLCRHASPYTRGTPNSPSQGSWEMEVYHPATPNFIQVSGQKTPRQACPEAQTPNPQN